VGSLNILTTIQVYWNSTCHPCLTLVSVFNIPIGIQGIGQGQEVYRFKKINPWCFTPHGQNTKSSERKCQI
jgi:hypothetical protein